MTADRLGGLLGGVTVSSVTAWGPALFSDDVACDVRTDYRELLEDGVDDDEALAQTLSRHLESLLDADDEPIVVLALAASASKLGRLTPEMRDRAVSQIDAGRGLQRWQDDPVLLRRRVAALARVRASLVGPQPRRKPVRRPPRKVTPVSRGDVLVVDVGGGRLRGVRVVRLKESRTFVVPEIQLLEWVGETGEQEPNFTACPDRPHGPFVIRNGRRVRTGARMTVFGAGDDPADVGFRLVARIEPRPGDDVVSSVGTGVSWKRLATLLHDLDAALR